MLVIYKHLLTGDVTQNYVPWVTLQRLKYPRYSDLTKDKEPSACSDTESGEFASDLGETGNSKCCGIYRYGYFTCIVVVT